LGGDWRELALNTQWIEPWSPMDLCIHRRNMEATSMLVFTSFTGYKIEPLCQSPGNYKSPYLAFGLSVNYLLLFFNKQVLPMHFERVSKFYPIVRSNLPVPDAAGMRKTYHST
jgi:hypothetical protein